ncbi:G patch domain-containing protein 4 [Rhinophrynus dorsalis]
MSDPSDTKSQGMRFAEEQLQKHGWTEGKGLGKRENGISEAIKVKVKCDHAGIGHNSAEQFTFHWWDHVFNKTASSIAIETDKDGVQVKRIKEEEDGGSVTNKKPRKALSNRDMLYGRFVKSATLLSGGEQPAQEPSPAESSDSSEDEDEKLDLSSATKLTDEDLKKVCGGRTAHKGARHGLTMSAKLSRLEEQERAFLEKYGKKEQKNEKRKQDGEHLSAAEDSPAGRKHKKKKKKREQDDFENVENDDSSQEAPIPKKKKKKKQKKVKEEEPVLDPSEEEQVLSTDQEEAIVAKKKKKSHKRHKEHSIDPDGQTEQSVESTDLCVKAKKKKKRKREAE